MYAMTNCIQFKDSLIDLFYGEIGEKDQSELLLHRDSCVACKSEWEQIAGVRLAFKKLPECEASQLSVNKVLAYARECYAKSVGGFLGLGAMFRGLKRVSFQLAPGMAVAFIVFSILLLFTSPQGPTGDIPLAAHSPSPAKGQSLSPLFGYVPDANNLGKGTAERSGLLKVPAAQGSRLYGFQHGYRGKTITEGLQGDFQNASSPDSALIREELLSEDVGSGALPLSLAELEEEFQKRQHNLLEADADHLLMRGRRFKSMGRVDLALQDFEIIYRFYPNYTYLSDVLLYRAQCYAFQGKVDEAIESLEILVKKYPSKKPLVAPMIQQIQTQAAENLPK